MEESEKAANLFEIELITAAVAANIGWTVKDEYFSNSTASTACIICLVGGVQACAIFKLNWKLFDCIDNYCHVHLRFLLCL